MGQADGFAWTARKNGEIAIAHRRRRAAILRGDRSAKFLAAMAGLDPRSQQEEMARLTANYRRGNERLARTHPRNG